MHPLILDSSIEPQQPSKGSLQNKINCQNLGNFPNRGGGKKFGGVIPKFYLEIYLEGGGIGPESKIPLNCLELIFLWVNLYSHMHNSQM